MRYRSAVAAAASIAAAVPAARARAVDRTIFGFNAASVHSATVRDTAGKWTPSSAWTGAYNALMM